jgi:Phage capsid family
VLSQGHQLLRQPGVVEGRRLSKFEQQKFLLRSVAPALIQPEEADRLIDYVVDESQMFRLATVERMSTNEQDIRFIALSGGVLRLATCNATPEESVSISNTNKCLKTISLDAKFFLCDDDLQDGLTGAQLEQQIMRMTADTMANELELVAWMGNTNNSYTAPTKVNNSVMAARDMWYRQLQQGHILNAGGFSGDSPAGGVARAISFHKMNCLQRALPTKYRRNPEQARYFMHPDVWTDFAELHQGRVDALGDRSLLGPAPREHMQSPVEPIALIPTDLRACGCESLSTATGTFVAYSDPSNFVVGIEKNITFERWRDGPRHLTWLIWTVRFDALIFNEDQTSLLDCMQLSTCGTGCTPPGLGANRCYSCLNTGS